MAFGHTARVARTWDDCSNCWSYDTWNDGYTYLLLLVCWNYVTYNTAQPWPTQEPAVHQHAFGGIFAEIFVPWHWCSRLNIGFQKNVTFFHLRSLEQAQRIYETGMRFLRVHKLLTLLSQRLGIVAVQMMLWWTSILLNETSSWLSSPNPQEWTTFLGCHPKTARNLNALILSKFSHPFMIDIRIQLRDFSKMYHHQLRDCLATCNLARI